MGCLLLSITMRCVFIDKSIERISQHLTPMLNLYETIKGGLQFNKFELGNIVCVEYNCPEQNEYLDIYSQTDYILHVLSGKKTWMTIHGKWVLHPGDVLYVKKGATIVRQFLEEDFCMLGFFIPDDLIKEAVEEIKGQVSLVNPGPAANFTASELKTNDYLDAYFQSMLTYFRGENKPGDFLLKHKLKELLINIVCSNENQELVAHLRHTAETTKPSLPHIMEANFRYNLSLEEFAKLCHRSLSSFKRDFHNHYDTTPGKWLLSKRLDYAAGLLVSSDTNISQIAFESGFEDVSHFSRVFRNRFAVSPSEFKRDSVSVLQAS